MSRHPRLPFWAAVGTTPFTKVLAGSASLPFLHARFTLPTAQNFPSGHRSKSLYTGMTPHPAHSFSCPKREDARVLPYKAWCPATVPILDDFLYEPFYQIMRQRLLADRMVEEGELGVDEAKVVVVVPEGNWAYRTVTDGRTTTSSLLAQRFPKLETVETVMRASLKDPDAQFDMVAPAQLLDGVARSLPDETVDWVNYWRDRYGV